jgi:thiamine-phosphate pyrophosphorylase
LAAFYPILDLELAARRGHAPAELALGLADLGVGWLQLRAKRLPDREFLACADEILHRLQGRPAPQILINDRLDLALCAGAHGVHLGQDDVPLAAARSLRPAGFLLGWSTHNPEQLQAAMDSGAADYLAYGPIFPTRSKEQPDPEVGLQGLAQARAMYQGPLVAIGGITPENCPAALAAGASHIAVIAGWLDCETPLVRARQYITASAF